MCGQWKPRYNTWPIRCLLQGRCTWATKCGSVVVGFPAQEAPLGENGAEAAAAAVAAARGAAAQASTWAAAVSSDYRAPQPCHHTACNNRSLSRSQGQHRLNVCIVFPRWYLSQVGCPSCSTRLVVVCRVCIQPLMDVSQVEQS